MPVRQISGKKPKNFGYTLRRLLSYMGRYRFLLLMVAILVSASALANLLGTYMIRPVVNSLASGSYETLLKGVAITAVIYAIGVLSAYGFSQIMVKAAQKVLFDIRRDLFSHIQSLPLRFFDSRRHGDVMSYFTNDVDTIGNSMQQAVSMVVQSACMLTGVLIAMFVTSWQLALTVLIIVPFMAVLLFVIMKFSQPQFRKQQDELAVLNGKVEENYSGHMVIKAFNAEALTNADFESSNARLKTTNSLTIWS